MLCYAMVLSVINRTFAKSGTCPVRNLAGDKLGRISENGRISDFSEPTSSTTIGAYTPLACRRPVGVLYRPNIRRILGRSVLSLSDRVIADECRPVVGRLLSSTVNN